MRTVQGELEGALERDPRWQAGRADGRRAHRRRAYTRSARSPASSTPGELPDRLRRAAERGPAAATSRCVARGAAPDGFDARRDARSRTYRYRVLASPIRDPFEEGPCAVVAPTRSTRERGSTAARRRRSGEHDFTAFTPTETGHACSSATSRRARWERRTRRCSGVRSRPRRSCAARCRVLVGTMLEVGGGRRSLEDFRALLDGAPRDRAGETAPAHGLYLVGVRY